MRRMIALLAVVAAVLVHTPAFAKARPPVLRRFVARYNPTSTTTFYVATGYDPEGSSLVYQWSLTAKCGFLTQPKTTEPSNGYQHGPPARKPAGCPIPDETASVITVKITDAEGCSIQYTQGARDERIHESPNTTPVRCSVAAVAASKGFPAGLVLFLLILIGGGMAFFVIRRRVPAGESATWDKRSEPGWKAPTHKPAAPIEPQPAVKMLPPEDLFAPPRVVEEDEEAAPAPEIDEAPEEIDVFTPLEIRDEPAEETVRWPEPVAVASPPVPPRPAAPLRPSVESPSPEPRPTLRKSLSKLFTKLPAAPPDEEVAPSDGAGGDGAAEDLLSTQGSSGEPGVEGATRNETNDVVAHDTVLAGPVMAKVSSGAEMMRQSEISPSAPGDTARILDGLSVSAEAPLTVEVEIPLRLVTVVSSRREIYRDGKWAGDIRSTTHDGPERTERLRATVTARADLDAFIERVLARRLGSLVEARRRLESSLSRR